MLQATSQSIDVRHFKYLKGLQNSAAGVLFEGSVKSLILQTFNIVIGAILKDFDTSPEDRTYVKAGYTLKALLDIWGKDGLENPEISTVCLRTHMRFYHPYGSYAQLLQAFMEERLLQVVSCGPLLVSTYLGLLSEQPGNTYWHRVIDVIVSFTTVEALDWLDKFNGTNAPQYLQPSRDFEEFVKKTITMVLEDGTGHLKQAISLLEKSGLCL